jgi:hypothetical protein
LMAFTTSEKFHIQQGAGPKSSLNKLCCIEFLPSYTQAFISILKSVSRKFMLLLFHSSAV